MSTSLALLDPEFRPWAQYLVDVAKYYGLKPRVTSTYRSLREQARLYDRYLRGQSQFPAALPGHSMHNYGLALDLVSEDNAWLGQLWNSWGGRWNTGDSVHFEVG